MLLWHLFARLQAPLQQLFKVLYNLLVMTGQYISRRIVSYVRRSAGFPTGRG